MSKGKIKWVGVLAALATLAMVGCGGNAQLLADKDAEIATLKSQVDGLEGQLMSEKEMAQKTHADLESELSQFKGQQEVLLDSINNMSIITISDAALFGFSSTHLTDNGVSLLDKIAGVIKNNPGRQIWIEGHTDNVPIAEEYREQFPSNWEFSSARAHSALQHLLKKHKLDPTTLAAVGYGQYHPVADNSTAAGQSQNRRVVIIIGGHRF